MPVLSDVFGSSTASHYQDLQADYHAEVARAKKNIKAMGHVRKLGTSKDNLGRDLTLAKDAFLDLRDAAKKVEKGKPFSEQRFDDMLDVFSVAIHILSCDNDALDLVWWTGVGNAFVLQPWTQLKNKAVKLKATLQDLEKVLKKAQQEATDAQAQAVFNAALTAVMLLQPQVGLLAIGGVAIAQMLVDHALGPDTGKGATLASQSNTSIGAISGAVEGVKTVSQKHRTIAKGAGKATVVIGIAFDVNEIATGLANVKAVEKKIASTRKELDDVLYFLAMNEAKLNNFFKVAKEYEEQIRKLESTASDARDDMAQICQSTGYYP